MFVRWLTKAKLNFSFANCVSGIDWVIAPCLLMAACERLALPSSVLIFDLSAIRQRADISVVRSDKILLSVPVGELRRGFTQNDYNEVEIARRLQGLNLLYLVIPPDCWRDSGTMARFHSVIEGPDYKLTHHFSVAGILSSEDGAGGVDIYQPTYAPARTTSDLEIDMPLAADAFSWKPPVKAASNILTVTSRLRYPPGGPRALACLADQ